MVGPPPIQHVLQRSHAMAEQTYRAVQDSRRAIGASRELLAQPVYPFIPQPPPRSRP